MVPSAGEEIVATGGWLAGPAPRALGHIDVVRYLRTTYALTAEDARARNNEALYNASENGFLDVVRVLCEEFGLTVDDVRAYPLQNALENEHHDIVAYLCARYDLAPDV